MKEFTKEEVVELTDDLLKHLKIDKDSFTGDRITSFLKEKVLIEPEFEVGKWWFHNTGTLELILEVTKFHGGTLRTIPIYGNAGEGKDSFHGVSTMDRPATDKEVSDALIKESQKYIGKTVECLQDGDEYKIEGGKFDFMDGELIYNYNADCCVLMDKYGKWAEIIEEEETPLEVVINGETYKKV